MVKLLIIADDFTGALDTGVQFAEKGIETQVFIDQKLKKSSISAAAQVLVVDSETRPLSAEEAYCIVKGIAKDAIALGIPTILKKTDSALRGNVGAELAAVLDASKEQRLYFIPAYPKIHRITKNGVHYIDGELLEESAFGKDPFEPARQSYIPELLHKQTEHEVECYKAAEHLADRDSEEYTGKKIITLFDAETEEEMNERVSELKNKGCLTLLAGCAGIAQCLTDMMQFESKNRADVKKTQGLYVACGSLNPITRVQVDDAVARGCLRINLTPEQKLDKEYYSRPEGIEFLNMLQQICRNVKTLIVDTFDLEDGQATRRYAKDHGIDKDKIRYRISECHGKIVSYLVEGGLDYAVLMTGGDTLMGFMKEIGCSEIYPVCEIEQGAVLSRLLWKGRQIQVISKSGGFGSRDIITNITKKIVERQRTV